MRQIENFYVDYEKACFANITADCNRVSTVDQLPKARKW